LCRITHVLSYHNILILINVSICATNLYIFDIHLWYRLAAKIFWLSAVEEFSECM